MRWKDAWGDAKTERKAPDSLAPDVDEGFAERANGQIEGARRAKRGRLRTDKDMVALALRVGLLDFASSRYLAV